MVLLTIHIHRCEGCVKSIASLESYLSIHLCIPLVYTPGVLGTRCSQLLAYLVKILKSTRKEDARRRTTALRLGEHDKRKRNQHPLIFNVYRICFDPIRIVARCCRLPSFSTNSRRAHTCRTITSIFLIINPISCRTLSEKRHGDSNELGKRTLNRHRPLSSNFLPIFQSPCRDSYCSFSSSPYAASYRFPSYLRAVWYGMVWLTVWVPCTYTQQTEIIGDNSGVEK